MEHKELKVDRSIYQDAAKADAALTQSAQAGIVLAEALEKARKAAKALASTSSRFKRVLAGFDEINRLGEKKKSGSSSKSTAKKTEQEQKTEQLTQETPKQTPQELPALEVTTLPAKLSHLLGLDTALELIGKCKDHLQSLWQETLVPFATWVSGTLFGQIQAGFAACYNGLRNVIENAGVAITQGWQSLSAWWGQTVENIGAMFATVKEKFLDLVTKILVGNGQLGSSADDMGQQIGGVVGVILSVLQALKTGWNNTIGGLKTTAGTVASGVVSVLQSVIAFLQGAFTKNWNAGFSGLKEPVRGIINSIIGFLNKMLSGLSGALNGVINAANRLKFTVPDWVPGIGGKQYGFSLKTVSVPQIPYLAKGAVLPANQPFLAVVGDQKHGTNVEAPLGVIQEAVAAVMADHTAGNMAGHEATVAVLRQILEAVLGIDVGEAVIARAAQSYQMKNAVMKGGGF
jgi:hypothetical protein